MKKDEQISDILDRLRELRVTDPGERINEYVLRWIEDPLKPKTKDGKLHVNLILQLLGAMALLATGTCVFFSLVQL